MLKASAPLCFLSLLTEVAEKLNYLSATSLTLLSILSLLSNRIFALKYRSIPSLLCARYLSKTQENEGIRCSLIYHRNERDLLTSSASPAEISPKPCHRSAASPSAWASTRGGLSFIAAFAATVEVFRSRLINGAEDSPPPVGIHGNTRLRNLETSSCDRAKAASTTQNSNGTKKYSSGQHLSARLDVCNAGNLHLQV